MTLSLVDRLTQYKALCPQHHAEYVARIKKHDRFVRFVEWFALALGCIGAFVVGWLRSEGAL